MLALNKSFPAFSANPDVLLVLVAKSLLRAGGTPGVSN